MPKKKPAKSGFFYFMMELRADEESQGRHHSMEALKELADIPWQNLSSDEKAAYNEMAKADKRKSLLDLEHKYTSLGVSFAEMGNMRREVEEKRNLMERTIQTTVLQASSERLLNKNFYFAHVNHYFVTHDKVYAPCEIALAEFSLMDGIKKTKHFILDAGKIPMGMKGDAMRWGEKTHGINILDSSNEELYKEKNTVKVFSEVVNFMEEELSSCGEKTVLPPIYTMPDSLSNNTSISSVQSCMRQLCSAAHGNVNLFRVFPIPQLFYHLNLKWTTDQAVHSIPILEHLIERDSFSNYANLGCEYHEEKDLSMHCSLSIVKRWIFTICDTVCPKAGVELRPGQHVPVDADVNCVQQNSEATCNPVNVGKEEEKIIHSPPQTVDPSKLHERRVREKEMVNEELARAESMPPPQKAWNMQIPKGLEDSNFPPVGGGRGQPLPQIPTAIWPISGRGKIVKK